MSNPNMESKVKELMELRRMKEELETEITAMEDEIKQTMGEEEILLAGSYKVLWKPVTTSRFDSVRFKKEHAELAEAYAEYSDTLIDSRNDGFEEQALAYLNSGKMALIAVGAFHIIGENGLAEKLARAGYTVEEIGRE